MEFWPPVPVDQVGGLDLFKRYIANRKKAFEPGNEHLPKPKALLLVGIPGTGKSLSCKAAASILGWPLIRLDISALKGSLVGESEQKIRQATDTIDFDINGNQIAQLGSEYLHVPVGTTANRPGSPSDGYIRYNSDLGTFEGYSNNQWSGLGGGNPWATKVVGDSPYQACTPSDIRHNSIFVLSNS